MDTQYWPYRFSKEYMRNGELNLSVVEENKQTSLVLTLTVNNYTKLKENVFYYKIASTHTQFKWRFKVAISRGTLFVILTTNAHNKDVFFSVNNIDPGKIRVHPAVEIGNGWKSVYVAEFCDTAILDTVNNYLPGDVLTVMCKYAIHHIAAIGLLLPLKQLKLTNFDQGVSGYFENIYLNPICADFKIKVRDSWFMVHKQVLRTCTDLFKIRFDGVPIDQIHETSFDTFSHIMHRVLLYVYSRKLDPMFPEYRHQVFEVALLMGITDLIGRVA